MERRNQYIALIIMAMLVSVLAILPALLQSHAGAAAPPGGGGGAASPGRVMVYYVQLELNAPGLASFLPPIDASATGTFGAGTLFAFNITQSASRDSAPLGFVRGFTIEASYVPPAAHGVEVAFIHYDDGKSLVGTIQIQGEVLDGASEIAIVGGTGSFRGARGYVLITLVNAIEPFRVFSHELHFM